MRCFYHNTDPWAFFEEWQEHRFDVGYFISHGRLAPFFRANGTLGFSIVLLFIGSTGILALLISGIPPESPLLFPELLFSLCYHVLWFFAGLVMLYRNIILTNSESVTFIIEDPTYNSYISILHQKATAT